MNITKRFLLFFMVFLCFGTIAFAATGINTVKKGTYEVTNLADGKYTLVYSGAGSNYSSAGRVKNGDVVEVVGNIENWYQINYYGRTDRYVYGKYLKQIKKSTTYYIAYTEKASMREEPNGSAIEVVKIPYGKKITVYKTKSGWGYSKYGEYTGWVWLKDLSKTKPTGKSIKAGYYKVVNVNTSLNVREEPSSSSNIVCKLKKNAIVYAFGGNKDGWCQVMVDDKIGYVSGKYITAVKTIKTTANLYMRKGPGTEYAELDLIPKGTALIVFGSKTSTKGGTWYKVQYNGNTGYVSANYTK